MPVTNACEDLFDSDRIDVEEFKIEPDNCNIDLKIQNN